MDPSAVEALTSVRRVLTSDGDGDHDDEADAIAACSAFRPRPTEPGDEERDYRMAVECHTSVAHLSHHLPRMKGCPLCDEGKHLHKYKRRRTKPLIYVTGPDALEAPSVLWCTSTGSRSRATPMPFVRRNGL